MSRKSEVELKSMFDAIQKKESEFFDLRCSIRNATDRAEASSLINSIDFKGKEVSRLNSELYAYEKDLAGQQNNPILMGGGIVDE